MNMEPEPGTSPSPPITGDAEVDAVISPLANLQEETPAQKVEVFDAVLQGLQDLLAGSQNEG